MIKKFLNKKAVSPVISTLLMVSIVFGMFAIIYPWAFSSLTLSQSHADLWYSDQEAAAKERIVVEMVVFREKNPPHRNVTIYVRNVGEIDVVIEEIYVNGIPETTDPALPKDLYVKEGTENCIDFLLDDYYWNEDEVYSIKVVTSRGGDTIFEARAPS
ncbi:MAG: hypothetical protein NWF08_03505 [Candidatus Bathyarchaeota archaeon]|nr:hypothetical protein [Candidatus Bathyarchaeota archaeon]